jgi:hypothetical protein
LSARRYADLGIHIAQVPLDGAPAKHQRFSNFVAASAHRHLAQHLKLARRERGGANWR